MSAITEELSALAGLWVVKTTSYSAPPAPGTVQVAAPNPLRWALLIGVPANNTGAATGVNLAVNGTLSNLVGVGLNAGGYLNLNYRDHGGLVQQAWQACSAGVGGDVVTVVETFAQQ